MSHDTHHDQGKEKKVSIVSFKNSFWLVIILVGLFIAALNFIKAESGGEETGKEKTEMKGTTEATGEKGEMKAEEPKQTETAAKDTTAKSAK